jgi:hypothetical protein
MAVLEDNIRSEAPDLSNRCYCRRPEAEETGHMALEKGTGCSSDWRLDGSQQDTQVADPVAIVSISLSRRTWMNPRICLPLRCLVYDLIGNAKSKNSTSLPVLAESTEGLVSGQSVISDRFAGN